MRSLLDVQYFEEAHAKLVDVAVLVELQAHESLGQAHFLQQLAKYLRIDLPIRKKQQASKCIPDDLLVLIVEHTRESPQQAPNGGCTTADLIQQAGFEDPHHEFGKLVDEGQSWCLLPNEFR